MDALCEADIFGHSSNEEEMMTVDEGTHDRWPRFELVHFSTPTGIPHGWDQELVSKGVPKTGGYEATRDLVLIEIPDYGPLILFGVAGPSYSVCLSPHTGEVIGILDVPGSCPHLINSSLDQFTASVRAILGRFPYDSAGFEEERGDENEWDRAGRLDAERTQAAEELVERLRAIDAAAVVDPDGFWMTFVADVQMGNYATKEVLGEPDE